MRLRVGLYPTLTKEILSKLQQNAICTVTDLIAEQDVEKLSKTLHVSCKDLITIRHVLSAQFAALPMCAADMYDDLMASVAILPTGCNSVDSYLDGGIYTMEVTELVGDVAAAKTQFCLNVACELAVTVQQNTVWIDTCGGFTAERFSSILQHRNLDHQKSCDACGRVQVVAAFDAMDVLAELEKISEALSQNDVFASSTRLIVLDSVAVMSGQLTGNMHLGQSLLSQVGRCLKNLAADFPVAVLVSNYLVGGDEGRKPAMGRHWASVPHTRILLSQHNSHRILPNGECLGAPGAVHRHAAILKSSRQASIGSAAFQVTDAGLQDA